MSELTYIPDSYTANGYVAEVPRKHGAIRFKYRPVLAEQRANVQEKMHQLGGGKAEKVASSVIAQQVMEWDAVDDKGDSLPILPEKIARLQPDLKSRIYGIVMGARASDADPDEKESPNDDIDAEAIAAAALGGESSVEASTAKN